MHTIQLQILQTMFEIGRQDYLSSDQIAQASGFEAEVVKDHLDVLEQQGYVTIQRLVGGGVEAMMTANGRILARGD